MNRLSFFFPVAMLLTFSLTVEAQIEKGTFRLGGAIGLSDSEHSYPNQPNSNAKIASFSFNPNVSYFVLPRFSAGILIPLTYTSVKQQGSWHSSSWSTGPVVRYYFPFEKWAAFPELTYTLGREYFYGGGGYSTIAHLNTLKAGVGLTYFLTKNVGLEGVLSYQDLRRHYDNESQTNSHTTAVNFNVGFQIYLSRESKSNK